MILFEGGVKSDIDCGDKDGEKDRDETDDLELWWTSSEGAGGEIREGGFGHDRRDSNRLERMAHLFHRLHPHTECPTVGSKRCGGENVLSYWMSWMGD